MTNIYAIIQELKSTRSRNEKESILKREINNEELKTFFRLALNPFINFYQKKSFVHLVNPNVFVGIAFSMASLEDTIASRKVTGNSAISHIHSLIDASSEDDAKVIMLILQKDSGCDIGSATINKIWKGLIPTFPVMLATGYTEKLATKLDWSCGVTSQTKSDGLRICLVIEDDGSVKAYSRAGNVLNVFGVFDFIGAQFRSCVIDGELLTVKEDGTFNPRTTSNGICSKAIKGTLSEEEATTLHITAWDLISLEDFKKEKSSAPYFSRFSELTEVIELLGTQNKISLIPSRTVYSIEEAQAHYSEEVASGNEGTMLKNRNVGWGDERSKEILKLKGEHTGDFEVIGYKPGEGRFLGLLGSLEIATSDRKVLANMSGFSIKLRSEIWANIQNAPVSYTMIEGKEEVTRLAQVGDCDISIGSIVECLYNCKIKAKDTDVYSIFLPRFQCARLDKTVANTIDELK